MGGRSTGSSYDVALVIRGLSRHHPKPGQLNVLWCISHPDELTGEECDGYDLVCVASEPFAEPAARAHRDAGRSCSSRPPTPRSSYPDPSPEYEHDLVYVANSRNVLRPIVRDLLPTDHDLAIYGANWEGLIDTKYVVAEHVPNDELRKVYSSAKIVLCDHWDDMRKHGFVSNRIYDALACGATIVSDEVVGFAERFGDDARTYRTKSDLRETIDRLLDEPPRSHSLTVGYDNTFSARVQSLLLALSGSAERAHFTTVERNPLPRSATSSC